MTTWAAAEAVAAKQHGMITLAQLKGAGLADRSLYRAVADGRLVRVLSKIYRFSITPLSWHARAKAAQLAAYPGDVLSHGSAAVLWRLNGFPAREDADIHLTSAGRRLRELGAGYRIHRPRRAFEPFSIDGFAVTRLARTLVDLAAVLPERTLEQALDRAHHREPRLERWLHDELGPLDPKRVEGVATLRKLLSARKGVAVESPLETDVRRFVRTRKVEEPTYQLEIHDEHGRIMRVDAAWESHRIALHTDSYEWHGDRQTFDDDAAKRRRLVAAGWASVAVTSTDLKTSAWFTQIEKLLHDRARQSSLFGFWGGKGAAAMRLR